VDINCDVLMFTLYLYTNWDLVVDYKLLAGARSSRLLKDETRLEKINCSVCIMEVLSFS
jgi:hypothetical protein